MKFIFINTFAAFVTNKNGISQKIITDIVNYNSNT